MLAEATRRGERRRAETEARLTDLPVGEAVGRSWSVRSMRSGRACADAEPALAEAAGGGAAMEAALPAQMDAAAAARAEAEAAAAARAEEEAAAMKEREGGGGAAASKAEAERARADELRLIQLQAELAARESAESRQKSEPERGLAAEALIRVQAHEGEPITSFTRIFTKFAISI